MAEFDAWIGRSRVHRSGLDPWPVEAMAATLGLSRHYGQEHLPLLWHWLYFLECAPRSGIGSDGHPQKGDFLPPVPNPRRMFGGCRTRVLRPLRPGRPAELTEQVRAVQQKGGGALFLVTVLFEYRQEGALCISEERDYVYLPAASGPRADDLDAAVRGPVAPAPWNLDVATDEVLLFRFSALTFNSHRIHYDRPYATGQEGYPRLVVHAPLTAMLLAHLAERNAGGEIEEFSFRAVSPAFLGDTLGLRGTPLQSGAAEMTAYTAPDRPVVRAAIRIR
jgi:3-methylfumaryl-CoA hydratase